MADTNPQLRERLEILEGEFDLLKTEIRSVLVDLHEASLKSDGFGGSKPFDGSATQNTALAVSAGKDSENTTLTTKEVVRDATRVAYELAKSGMDISARSSGGGTVNDVIKWIGDSKERGLTATRLFPILDAYETSGMMTPLMAKFILKSMSVLDEVHTDEEPRQPSPSDLSTCLGELHKLVCLALESAGGQAAY